MNCPCGGRIVSYDTQPNSFFEDVILIRYDRGHHGQHNGKCPDCRVFRGFVRLLERRRKEGR